MKRKLRCHGNDNCKKQLQPLALLDRKAVAIRNLEVRFYGPQFWICSSAGILFSRQRESMVKLILKILKNPKRIQLLLGTAAILKNTPEVTLIVTGRLQNPRGASRKQHVFPSTSTP